MYLDILVVCALGAAAATPSPPLTALVLPQEFAQEYGAACLDGTPPAIYYHIGADTSTWVLFLEGGGWCFDVTPELTLRNCFGRAGGGLGSSAGIVTNQSTTVIGGLLSTDPAVNPRFYNASLVFAHYCDGASFSSFVANPIPAPPELLAANASTPKQIFMRGRANLQAVVNYLLSELGMARASTLILSGGSAGATGVFLGLDFVAGWLPPGLRLLGAPDAGFFLDLPRASNASDFWYRQCFEAADAVWGGGAAGTLSSPDCLAAAGAEPWRCYLPEFSLPFLKTPILVSNSAIDMWGLLNVLGLNCVPTMNNASFNHFPPCGPAQWELLQGWWAAFHAKLAPALNSRNHSAWIASCFVHEINVDYCSGQSLPNCRGWAKYTVAPSEGGAPVTLQQATGQWADAMKLGAAPPRWVDAQTYPMNPSCVYPPG